MNYKTYRKIKNLSIKQMVEQIKPIFPEVTIPLWSQIENDIIRPPKAVEEWFETNDVEPCECTPQEVAVLEELLRHSKEDPLTRNELKAITKTKDSAARCVIGSLRDKGYAVAFNNGYYLAGEDEIPEFINRYKVYIYTMLRRIKAIESRPLKGQIKL